MARGSAVTSKCLRQACLLKHIVRGVTRFGRARHREVALTHRRILNLMTALTLADKMAAIYLKNPNEIAIKIGHQAPATSRCSSALNVRERLSVRSPDTSKSSGNTSRTSSIIEGHVSASITRPDTSLLVAIQTLASGSQRAFMVIERFIG